MRYTRGLSPSLGASGSLLAAAACALFAVSATVGFRGWPGLSREDGGARDLVVAQQSPRLRAQSAGRPSGEFAPRRAPRLVLAAAEPASTGSLPAASRRPADAPAHAPAVAPAASSSPAVAPAPPAAAAPAPARAISDPVSRIVRDTGQSAGATVAPVSPTAARTVTTATDTVAAVVDKTGKLLAP